MLTQMCHTDVVIGGSAGRMVGQRVPFIAGLPVSPGVVLALFIVPSQSTQVYLERKIGSLLCLSAIITLAQGINWVCTPSISGFTHTLNLCSLGCKRSV